MSNVENKDVNETAQVAPVQEQDENSTVVREDEKTPDTKVDRKVYESVRDAMKREREEKRAKDTKIAELEARLAEVESRRGAEDDEDDEPQDSMTKAKVDILYLVQTDPFVKENLDLIEEKMTDNPRLTAKEAIKEIKSDFFDRMSKESVKAAPEVPLKQITPKGNSTITRENVIKDALEGRNANADSAQMEAYRRQIERLG
ncbi:MAG: hypothetical protein WCW14_00625 [Candidatus Paceibacterota bacterium]|jgi:hypothetical protein